MWILPKQLISAFAPATEVLTLDSSEASLVCEQSLMRRSKPSRAKCYLREWKQGNLMRLRYGLISNHSHGRSFEDWWTSSLVATHASHSQQPDLGEERMTQDISGHGSQMELGLSGQDSASLKTSRDISAWGCATSSKTWSEWVTECRGEYSQRLKLALLIKESECSYWPTASSRDWKDSPGMSQTGVNPDGSQRKRVDQLARAVYGEEYHSRENAMRMASVHCAEETTQSANAPDQLKMDLSTQSQAEHYTQDWSPSGHLDLEKPSTNGSHRGSLNPDWVEALMGLPIGWTDYDS